ncbi:hypothetical protein IKR55_03205 [bacterium]|nr:hypothetical protein [bacterium]
MFFYIVSTLIDNGISWDLSKFVTINAIIGAMVYSVFYGIIRLIAGKIKKKTLETEPPAD